MEHKMIMASGNRQKHILRTKPNLMMAISGLQKKNCLRYFPSFKL